MKSLDLFNDPQARKRWTGSRALVVLDRDVCPECGGRLREQWAWQLPLLRHGGFGACGWSVVRSVTETKP